MAGASRAAAATPPPVVNGQQHATYNVFLADSSKHCVPRGRPAPEHYPQPPTVPTGHPNRSLKGSLPGTRSGTAIIAGNALLIAGNALVSSKPLIKNKNRSAAGLHIAGV